MRILGLLSFLALSASAATLRTNVDQMFLEADAPRNYIKNSGAEKNDSLVTDSSSIHTRSTSSPLMGAASHAIDASAGSQNVDFTAYDFDSILLNTNCEAKFSYSGDASLYTAIVRLNGADIGTALTLTNVVSGAQNASINFPCSTVTSPVVRISSTGNGAAIKLDNVYIGKATNVGTIAQAEVLLRAQRTGTDQSILSTSATPLQWNTATIDPYSGLNTSTGVYTAKKAQQIYVSVRVYLQGYNAAEANEIAVRKNGTATCRFTQIATAATEVNNTISGCLISVIVGDTIDVTSATVVEAGYLFDGDSSTNKSGFEILGLPNTGEISIRPDQSGLTPWQSVTFTGSWNTNTTYTGYVKRVGDTAHFQVRLAMSGAPNSAALTLNLPSGYVVDTAKVFASGANENLGHVTIQDSGTAQYFGRVAYNSTTVVSIRTAGAASTYADLTNVTQAVPIPTIANGDTFFAEFSVPIVGWSYTMPAPLLVGSVTSNAVGALRIEYAQITPLSGASCTVSNESSDWLGATTPVAVGACTVAINASTFSSAPICQVTSANTNTAPQTFLLGARINSVTTSSLSVYHTAQTGSTTSANAETLNVLCMGPR